MRHQLPSEFTADMTDYEQYMNLLLIYLFHLVAEVKNHWKEINAQATIRRNTVIG